MDLINFLLRSLDHFIFISILPRFECHPSFIMRGDYKMKKELIKNPHPYVGMWVTADGYIRHELLPNGRYDEARGNRESAYQGSYIVKDNHIEYVDDTGFTANGDFINGVLYHAGMVLYLEEGSKE